MNLDKCVNLLIEGNYDFLTKIISNGGEKKFDLLAAENARQERIEKQIKDAIKKGASKEEIAKLKKKLGVSGAKEKFGPQEKKTSSPENTQIVENINKLKGKLYKKIVEFCNLTGGVGIHGDLKVGNATRQVASKTASGEDTVKTEGIPSEALLRAKLADLKADAEVLKNYEYGHSKNEKIYGRVNKEYVKAGKMVSAELLKVLNGIHISQFDWDEMREPIISSARVATGRDGYLKVNAFSPTEAKKLSAARLAEKGLGPGVRVIGKKRFNADVFEDLYPFIREFRRYSSDYNPHNIDLTGDLLAKTKDKYDERRKAMEKAVDDSDEAYEARRKIERGLEGGENAKDLSKDETGKIRHDEYNALRRQKMAAKREVYATDGKKSTVGFLEDKGIQKLTIKTFLKKVATWKEKDANHVLKIFGTMPVLGNAGGILVFGPASLNADGKPAPNQASYEGLYAFQVTSYFFNNMGSEARKFTEDKRVSGRTKSAWKDGAMKALGLSSVDTEVEEEVNYFNY